MYTNAYNKIGDDQMTPKDRSYAALLVLQYLQSESSEEHGAGTGDIAAMLEEHGISCDRRTIYSLLSSLKKAGYDVRMQHRSRSYTYYLANSISSAEAFILLDTIRASQALSAESKNSLTEKLMNLLSREDKALLPAELTAEQDSGENHLLPQISVLLKAVHRSRMVSFLYFDYTAAGKKTYRHDGTPYRLQPIRVLSRNGRYYCIFWSELRGHPLNFRIDKMENTVILDEACDPVQFDLDGYMQKTFHMYTGALETVTAVFRNDMSSILFDTFEKENIMINRTDEECFTASIRTAVTPTLVSWFLQFYDRVTVVRPQTLIDRLTAIARQTLSNYGNGGIDNDRS